MKLDPWRMEAMRILHFGLKFIYDAFSLFLDHSKVKKELGLLVFRRMLRKMLLPYRHSCVGAFVTCFYRPHLTLQFLSSGTTKTMTSHVHKNSWPQIKNVNMSIRPVFLTFLGLRSECQILSRNLLSCFVTSCATESDHLVRKHSSLASLTSLDATQSSVSNCCGNHFQFAWLIRFDLKSEFLIN